MEIKNKLDFINADIANFIKLSADDIVITSVNEIWDGPLDGTCTWKLKDGYYFYSIDQLRQSIKGARFPNKFILIKLNSKQIEQVNGQGENFILNKCTEGVTCEDPEHEINRRVEFIIFEKK